MIKKCLIAFCIVMLLTLPVFAAGSVTATISASDKTVKAGEKVTVTVSAKVDTCDRGGIEISYDSAVFELVSGEWLLDNTFLTDFSTNSKDGVFAFESATAVSGKVFKFTLKAKDNAPVGKSDVSVKFTADTKKSTASVFVSIACNHSYSNACDTTCDTCGETRKISHSWNKGKVTQAASCTATGIKTFTCKVCAETKTEKISKKSHNYNNGCDATCNSCGAERKVSHEYIWGGDSTEHWQECTDCGEKKDVAAHSVETVLSGNETGHGYACSVCGLFPEREPHVFGSNCDEDCATCGYVRTVNHIYNERLSYDAEGHWYACIVCQDEFEKTPHVPGDAATETTDQLCVQCGYILEVAGNHIHSMVGDWLSDEDGHWYLCRCGEPSETEEHEWDEGTVVEESGVVMYTCTACGKMTAEVYVPETEPIIETEPEPEPEKPEFVQMLSSMEEIKIVGDVPLWFGIIALLCVLNIISFTWIVISICKAVRKSKVKGKYE